jgi:hypothetical protein
MVSAILIQENIAMQPKDPLHGVTLEALLTPWWRNMVGPNWRNASTSTALKAIRALSRASNLPPDAVGAQRGGSAVYRFAVRYRYGKSGPPADNPWANWQKK